MIGLKRASHARTEYIQRLLGADSKPSPTISSPGYICGCSFMGRALAHKGRHAQSTNESRACPLSRVIQPPIPRRCANPTARSETLSISPQHPYVGHIKQKRTHKRETEKCSSTHHLRLSPKSRCKSGASPYSTMTTGWRTTGMAQ